MLLLLLSLLSAAEASCVGSLPLALLLLLVTLAPLLVSLLAHMVW
jgi:hypothetical protein